MRHSLDPATKENQQGPTTSGRAQTSHRPSVRVFNKKRHTTTTACFPIHHQIEFGIRRLTLPSLLKKTGKTHSLVLPVHNNAFNERHLPHLNDKERKKTAEASKQASFFSLLLTATSIARHKNRAYTTKNSQSEIHFPGFRLRKLITHHCKSALKRERKKC